LFLGAGGHTLPCLPKEASEQIRLLQAKLLMEETLEAIEAMGVVVQTVDGHDVCIGMMEFYVDDRGHVSLPSLAKELADVRVVATGTMSLFGIADEEVQEAVDANNIAKVEGKKAEKREDGKIVKSGSHPKPDIAGILQRQTEYEV
jgi:predicted HAD superfamily Cof-like phosphohydrolase